MNAAERTIRAQASILRKACRPLLPVRIFFRKEIDHEGVKCEGLCRINHKRGRPVSFSIFIKRASKDAMSHVLVHEWAHALTWVEGEHADIEDDHDAVFGVAQARCYRALQD